MISIPDSLHCKKRQREDELNEVTAAGESLNIEKKHNGIDRFPNSMNLNSDSYTGTEDISEKPQR